MPGSQPSADPDSLRDFLSGLDRFSGRELAIEPLAGGMTNRNYLVRAGDESFVVRVAGEGTGLLGIDRDREAACARAAAEAGVAPGVVAYRREPARLVTRFVPGRVLSAEALREPATLRRVAEALRGFHHAPSPAGLAGFSPFDVARGYLDLARARGVAMPPEMDRARAILGRIEPDARGEEDPCLCHNDLLPANLIEDGRRVWVIDWEFAARGDRWFDLGNLAANAEMDGGQEEALLLAYRGQARPGDLRRLRLMRLASDFREATWGYLQSALSDVNEPAFYLDYGRRHLARVLVGEGGLAW